MELDNPHEFLNNGAASVGLVGPLFDAKDISEGNWDSITAKVELHTHTHTHTRTHTHKWGSITGKVSAALSLFHSEANQSST